MSLGRDDFHVLHPDAPQFVGDELRRLLHIGLVFLKRADAGNAEQILQFTYKTLLILTGKIECR